MKLPSIKVLSNGLVNTAKRFPIQLLIAVVTTICWCYYIHLETDYDSNTALNDHLSDSLMNGILVLNISLVLTLAFDLFAESRNYGITKKWLMRLAAIAFCAVLYTLLEPTKYIADLFKVALLSFSFHLLVAFAPFIGRQTINGFWQFNKALFLRFLTSALYAAVLFAGLAAALAAIHVLFNVDIKWEAYATMFAIIVAGFSTLFFLAGVPATFTALEADTSYPKGLKIFTQYVLIPLMTIYLAILLVYEIKIGIAWHMPKGMVSNLIIGYAVFGILSLLLIHPIKETVGNNWIKLFSRFFYLMMIPLLVLLVLAIWKRVGHYGITESRYILIVLALWLSGITLYFLLSKKQNIKIIPISLSIVSLLAVYGPQSAFSVSKYSQLARLQKLMKSKDIAAKQQVSSVIEYLVDQHGLQSLQSLTTVDLKRVERGIDARNENRYLLLDAKRDTAFALLKQEHVSPYAYSSSTRTITFINTNNEFLNIKGYDFVTMIESYDSKKEFEGKEISMKGGSYNDAFILKVDKTEVMRIDLMNLYREAAAEHKKNESKRTTSDFTYYYPVEKMTFKKQSGAYEFTVIVTSISGYLTEEDEAVPVPDNWINTTKYLLIKKL